MAEDNLKQQVAELELKLQALKVRVEQLEGTFNVGGVFTEGAANIVKDYGKSLGDDK